jgi:hypothetical protein
MEKDDILDKLFVDEKEVNQQVIYDILSDFVRLAKDGNIVLLAPFNSLNNEKKVLLVLLARKVLAIKNIASEFISPTEVQAITGMPKGTVNPTLWSLAMKGYLKNYGGKYGVPSYSIIKIQEYFRNKEM